MGNNPLGRGRAACKYCVFKWFEHVDAGRTCGRQCIVTAGTHHLAWLAPQVRRDLQTIDDLVRSSRPTAAQRRNSSSGGRQPTGRVLSVDC